MCFDLKKVAQNEIKCSNFLFGGHFFGVFFGQVRAKILRTLKDLPAPTPMYLRNI